MQLRQKIALFVAVALSLLIVELVLSALGVGLFLRIGFALIGIGAAASAAVSWYQATARELNAIRTAIDETAGHGSVSPLINSSSDEIGMLAQAVQGLRDRLALMNQLLVKSMRIESLNMLGSILAHDMKNLSFRLRCLAENFPGNFDNCEFRDSLVRTLNETTQQMDQMVRRFRDQKDTVIVKLRINLNEVLCNALDNIRRDGGGIRITEEYDDLPLVWADALLIENAVYNILDNACAAMPWGGHLAVRTKLIQNGESNVPQVLIEIADSGVGMPEDFIQNELFAPFVTTKTNGLGLGLYTCQQVIRMHGGKIRVYSELQRGSVFSIYLPVTD